MERATNNIPIPDQARVNQARVLYVILAHGIREIKARLLLCCRLNITTPVKCILGGNQSLNFTDSLF